MNTNTTVTVKTLWAAINASSAAADKKHEFTAAYFKPAKTPEAFKELHALAKADKDRSEIMRLNASIAYCRKIGTLKSFKTATEPTREDKDTKAINAVNVHAKAMATAYALLSKAEKTRVHAGLVEWFEENFS